MLKMECFHAARVHAFATCLQQESRNTHPSHPFISLSAFLSPRLSTNLANQGPEQEDVANPTLKNFVRAMLVARVRAFELLAPRSLALICYVAKTKVWQLNLEIRVLENHVFFDPEIDRSIAAIVN